MGRLGGRVAVVTGGASGIGRATAGLLAGEGASVVVVDLDAAGAARVAAEVGGTAAVLDVADPAGWGRLTDQLGSGTGDGGGGLDIAVLNAGVVTGEDRIAELGDAAYRRIMAVNVDGVVFGTRAVVPLLARRGGGSIVATSSPAGIIPYPPPPVSAPTKPALGGFV